MGAADAFMLAAVPMFAGVFLTYLLYQVLKVVLKKAEQMNKKVQEEVAEIEDQRRKTFLEREQRGEDEFFFEKYGYSYDWVFVFRIHDEPVEIEDAFQAFDESVMKKKKEEWKKNLHRDADFKKYFSMKTVIEHLQLSGMETKLFYSTQRDECFCKIRCPPEALEKTAEMLEYKVELDPDRASYCMRKGRTPLWEGREIRDVKNQATYGVFEHIYGRFQCEDEKLILYKQNRLANSIESPFRCVDRIKLMNELFKKPASGPVPGCSLQLGRLVECGCLIGYFPLHDLGTRIQLEKKWLQLHRMPNKQPIASIRNYYGEKIAMYFAWLSVYTTFLLYASLPGFITYCVAFGEQRTDSTLTPAFAAFMAVWATIFLECWKRAEITYVMEWGMVGYEQKETNRVEFWGLQRTPEGAQVTSPVDGEPSMYFPPAEKSRRQLFSNVVTVVFIAFVMFVVYYTFALKAILSQEPYKEQLTLFGLLELSTIIPSTANAVSITIFSIAWKIISLKLTINENHRTDTAFEDSLIGKTFSFEFVNKYAACFFAGFAKKYLVENDICDPTCFDELSQTLGILFIVELAVGNTAEVLTSIMAVKKKQAEESAGVSPDRNVSQIEKQYSMEPFDKLLGTFRQYQEMAFQFGYATLFSVAFPLAPVLAFVSNFVEIRVAGWKLLQCTQRPEPEGIEDIGTWYSILDLISTLAVVTNGLLLFFVAEGFAEQKWTTRLVSFILFEHILLLAKFAAGVLIPDVPISTEIQLQRQEFVEKKLIENVADDRADLGGEENADIAFEIADEDEDPVF
jgi:hypothetical protein